VVVLDVRPPDEFDTAHLPYARSMPLPELAQRLAELPRDVQIVAYCRGPFCLMSDEAVRLLRSAATGPARPSTASASGRLRACR
jgi:rhodanese-related sulfurtransferase